MEAHVKHSFLVAAVAIVFSSLAVTARAADMPVKAAPMAPAAIAYNWTGIYVGGLGGYGSAKGIHCALGFVCDPVTDPKGWSGGVTLGYNWQLANWVLGVEGDGSLAHMSATAFSDPIFGCGGGANDGCVTKIKSYETVRARLGWAFDRFLPYVTAGAAFTQLEASIGGAFPASGSTTKTSFAAGGGLEYAFWQNFSAKAEYLYISPLGNFQYDTIGACGAGCYVHVGAINLVRFGVNWRFAGH